MTDGREGTAGGRKPGWLRTEAPSPRRYRATGALLTELGLSTVCREARCPNKSECYSAGTASFLILGETCTRHCRFCAIGSGPPAPAKASPEAEVTDTDDQPRRVAEAVRRLGLRHVVITSVTRDDLPDGGAGRFAQTIRAVRAAAPGASVEVLIPDFGGDRAALGTVFDARPDVLAHNLETVPRLYDLVRPAASFQRSLDLLREAATWAWTCARAGAPNGQAPRPIVKTGVMLGLGERDDEVELVLALCAAAGVDAVTLGQYLQPRRSCLPVASYASPARFIHLRERGTRLGLTVQAGPLVRSSYRAHELVSSGRHGDEPQGCVSRSDPPA